MRDSASREGKHRLIEELSAARPGPADRQVPVAELSMPCDRSTVRRSQEYHLVFGGEALRDQFHDRRAPAAVVRVSWAVEIRNDDAPTARAAHQRSIHTAHDLPFSTNSMPATAGSLNKIIAHFFLIALILMIYLRQHRKAVKLRIATADSIEQHGLVGFNAALPAKGLRGEP